MSVRLIFILFLIAIQGNMFSQDSTRIKRPWLIALTPHYGFIVPHTKQIEHLIQGHSYGLHLDFFRKANGTSYWHYAYNQPEQGISLTFINTGNPAQLGQQYSTSFFLNLPLNRKDAKKDEMQLLRSRTYAHWLGLGLGCGYMTKIWDIETNHQAAVLGSHMNIALTLQYAFRIAQFKYSELRAGVRVSHFSNGAFQLPNLGTNNAALFLCYRMRALSQQKFLEIREPIFSRIKISIAVLAGLKEIPPPNEVKYAIGVISILGERRVSYKSSFGIGADFFYNSALRTLMERRTEESVSRGKVIQSGLLFSYTLHFNDFELKMQQGFYLQDNWKVDGRLYHRFGLRYFIKNNLFAQLTLKTHFAKADYGELGIGWAFLKKH